MNIPDFYDMLVRARRLLWACLEAAPDELLARPVLPGERFHCVKDLVLHVPAVEDSWLHEDILPGSTPVWETALGVQGAQDGPYFAATPLPELLNYWRAVETATLAYLHALTPQELARPVQVVGAQDERYFTVDGLLWHVMTHELRHTAQISMLLRQAGIAPPALDLLGFLPRAQLPDAGA